MRTTPTSAVNSNCPVGSFRLGSSKTICFSRLLAPSTTCGFDLISVIAPGQHGANRLRRFAPHARRHRLRAARRDAHH